MVEGQGGDKSYAEHPEKLPKAPYSFEVLAEKDGFITHMDTESVGIASVMLGAGRGKKDDVIDPSAGILLKKKYGDSVKKGEALAVLYASKESLFADAAGKLKEAYVLGAEMPLEKKLIYARVTKDQVERF